MKLIDLLVKELPKRGGWPEAAVCATQDKDGEVCFSEGATPVFCSVAWRDGDWCVNEFITITASDYDTAIITRAQYESALAASDGWIDWHGGECPVDGDTIVEVRFSSGELGSGVARADSYIWRHDLDDVNIAAYRPHRDLNSNSNDDRLEQDLNECIGQGIDIPEWNGGGLPPVGCECEWQDKNTKQWQPVKVVYSSEWVTVVREINKEKGGDLVDIAIENYGDESRRKFRPLRTEAEKAREKAITELASVICGDVPDTGMATAAMYAARIYDAGYRKEKK